VEVQQVDLAQATDEDLQALLRLVNPTTLVQLAALTVYAPPAPEHPQYKLLNTEIPVRLHQLFEEHCLSAHRAVKSFFASSDMVFDGAHAPYAPHSATCPLSIYGQSKVEAERHLLGRALVGRLPLMYGLGGSFFQVICDSLHAKQAIQLLHDEHRSLAWATDVAGLIVEMLAHYERFDLRQAWHCGGPARASRYELGLALASHDKTINVDLIIKASATEVIKGPSRPQDTTLTSDLTFALLNRAPLLSLEAGVAAALAEGKV